MQSLIDKWSMFSIELPLERWNISRIFDIRGLVVVFYNAWIYQAD